MNQRHCDIHAILRNAVAAVEPAAAVKRYVSRAGSSVVLRTPGKEKKFPLETEREIFVVGCGKAGAPMTLAIEELLADRITGGAVTVKYDHRGPHAPCKVHLYEGAHPEPDDEGALGCAAAVELLRKAGDKDLVIAPVSGGGSSLWVQPAAGLTLANLRRTGHLLLGCGASIHEINAVRKHLSAIKGGQAARLALPAETIVLAVSDVMGDDLDVIASGPFMPDSSTFADALAIANRYGIMDALPQAVQDRILAGARGDIEETPKVGESCFQRVHHVICASNRLAVNAAAAAARNAGYRPSIFETPLSGEARDVARAFCRHAAQLPDGACLIGGGETTVTLGSSPGMGGRNQEFALAAAIEIEGNLRLAIAGFGTDGTDGPTNAAGAIADTTTVSRARANGFDPRHALITHNAYPVFDSLGDLIVTGPTNTNVMDLAVAIVSPSDTGP